MHIRRSGHVGTLGGALALLALAAIAHADPVVCQKQVIKTLASFKKISLTAPEKCLDKENQGKLPGPCPDLAAQMKIQKKIDSSTAKISTSCTMVDLAALGFPGDCHFEAATQGAEGHCFGLPVTMPAEFAACLQCWKAAEVNEFLAVLYASHALEVCGSLGESSPNCSDLDFTSPQPIQRNLGDTAENDCQIGIGKAGVKYLLTREKTLEKCALAGGTRATCLADQVVVQPKLQKAETKKKDLVQKKCGNRHPVANPPFCCRTAPMMQACMAAASRDDCTMNIMGDVIEGKTCVAGSCQPTMGNQTITWWEVCPETGDPLATRADLVACVDHTADLIVDELLCLQFRGNGGADWPCPAPDGSPSGAFVQ